MQAERWKKVEELYQAAIALSAQKRGEFLASACPDAALRLEVESLLDQNADSFLESGLVSPALAPGTRLGNFELVELIGRGGPPYPTPMLPVSVTLGGVPLPAANIAFCRPDLLRRGADEHLDPVQRSPTGGA